MGTQNKQPSRTSQDSIQERHMKRQRKKRRRRIIFRTTLTLLLLGVLCIVAMFLTPWFNILEVSVAGNEKVSFESIVAASEIELDSNIFTLDIGKIARNVETVPYVKSASVARMLPSKVEITIEESRLAALISMGDIHGDDGNIVQRYIGLDDNGELTEMFYGKPEGYIVVTGIDLKEMQPGEKIGVDESAKFDIILLYIAELDEYGLLGDVDSLDVENMINVQFIYQGRLKVFCGDGSNLDRKMRTLKEIILNQLDADAKGEVDVRIEGKSFYRE